MTDLEIIKDRAVKLYQIDYYDYAEELCAEIVNSAERMETELVKSLSRNMVANGIIRDLNNEITRLKAELASKPVYPHVEIKTKPKPWSECAFEKNGSYCRHCGRGVKKESEGKNGQM